MVEDASSAIVIGYVFCLINCVYLKNKHKKNYIGRQKF